MNWNDASKKVYTVDEIDDLASNSIVTLKHNPSGTTLDVPLRTKITRWSQNSDGTWSTTPLGTVQVIYPYQPEGVLTYVDGVVRPRSYSTFSNYSYKSVIEGIKPIRYYEQLGTLEWKVYEPIAEWSSWSSYKDGTEDYCSYSAWCDSQNETWYKWYNWTAWSGYSTAPKTASSSRQVESYDEYSQVRYSSWSSWSSWTASYHSPYSLKEVQTETRYKYYKREWFKNRYRRYKLVCDNNNWWGLDKTIYGNYSWSNSCPSGYSKDYSKSGYQYETKKSTPSGTGWKLYNYKYYVKYDTWDTWNYNQGNDVYTSSYYSSAPSGYPNKSGSSKKYYRYRTRTSYVYKTTSKPWDSWNYTKTTFYRYRDKHYTDYYPKYNPGLTYGGYTVDKTKSKNVYRTRQLNIVRTNTWWQETKPTLNGLHLPNQIYHKNESRYVDGGWVKRSELDPSRTPTGASKLVNEASMIKGYDLFISKEVLYGSEILSNADSIFNKSVRYSAYTTIVKSDESISASEFESEFSRVYKYSNWYQTANYDSNNYLDSKRFAPRVFIVPHWRADKMNVIVDDFKDVPKIYSNNFTSTSSYSFVGEPIIQLERETVNRFFDYKNPFPADLYPNGLPANWEGQEALINEIKNVNFEDSQFEIILSKDDIAEIQEWLNAGGYDQNGTGNILREFRHIFTKVEPGSELDEFLNE